jgi:organic radical activating enzyme
MKSIQHFIQRFFPPAQSIPAGIYHYQAPAGAPTPLRMHLRIEPDGNGLLILNASTVLHLNQTAAELAYHLVKQTPEHEVGTLLSARYQVQSGLALQDFREFKQRIDNLLNSTDLDPTGAIGFERAELYSSATIAPYRLDCALTYQLSTPDPSHLAPTERVKRELQTQEWQVIMGKAWLAGIPHVIFTGGEPTLRPDLPELIAHTEKIGMVCGLLTDGLRLAKPEYLQQILQSGLDHIMLLLDIHNEQSWSALQALMSADIAVTVHLTVTAANAAEIPAVFERLVQLNVKQLSLSTDDIHLKDTQASLRRLAADLGLSLVWDLPVPYSNFHPVALETADDQRLPGAGRAWLYVEPDGDVLPTQGDPHVMGNLLSDSWEAVWAKRV